MNLCRIAGITPLVLAACSAEDDRLAEIVERFGSADERVQEAAANEAIAIGPPAIPALVAVLGDRQKWGPAAYALGHIGEPALPAVLHALENDSPLIRRAATLALFEMGPSAKTAVPALVARLRDPDASFRQRVATTLTEIDRDAARAALKDLEGDPAIYVELRPLLDPER